MQKGNCSTPHCTRPQRARGFCDRCYARAHAAGQLPNLPRPTTEQRFLAKVQKIEGGCWVWTAHLFVDGYGQFYVDGRQQRAHRVSYEMYVGLIPPGRDLDHVCHNADASCPGGESCPHRRCVNPEHLDPVSHRENMLRGRGVSAINVVKTECINGHPFDMVNTYIGPQGNRTCRACRRERERIRKTRIREATHASA